MVASVSDVASRRKKSKCIQRRGHQRTGGANEEFTQLTHALLGISSRPPLPLPLPQTCPPPRPWRPGSAGRTPGHSCCLGLGELHLVHALARVPVPESLAPERGCELLWDTLEQLLVGRAIAPEVADIFNPRGGMSQTAVLTFLGIHLTK